MKLACSTYVFNRLQTNYPVNNNRRYVKSTLALCKNSSTSDNYCVILFSSLNKNGTKYNIKNNILKVLNRFVNEGKTTLQFKYPSHDIFIQAEIIQLKSFLSLIRRILENKIGKNDITCSSMSVKPISSKDLPIKQLIIKRRSDYPSTRFPRTLESLFINDLNRSSLDKDILHLFKLKELNLNNNSIEFLPEEFSNLNLLELDLSKNCFYKSTLRKWAWMSGNLAKSLTVLNLSENNLLSLPNTIAKLKQLSTLDVSHNQLEQLPYGIGYLSELRILNVSYNKLSSLPGSIKKCCPQSIDISFNKFDGNEYNSFFSMFKPPVQQKSLMKFCTLKELSSKSILHCGIQYSPAIIPLSLVYYLDEAKYCVCGEACFETFIRVPEMLFLNTIVKNFSTSVSFGFIEIDCYYCSTKCYNINSRIRRSFVR